MEYMNYINSMKIYFKNHSVVKFIVNLFFLSVALIYLFPFWGNLIFNNETQYLVASLFHLDILLTGPMTLLFIYVYTKVFETSKLGFIFIILYFLNTLLAVFTLLMGLETILDFLLLLPHLLGIGLIVRLCILDYKKKNSTVQIHETQIYKINLFHIIITIAMPLIIINIIGRIYFIFAN